MPQYLAVFQTAVHVNAGSTANVTLTMHGLNGEIEKISFSNSSEDGIRRFERGKAAAIHFYTETDFDFIYAISLEHDNLGRKASWWCDFVNIINEERHDAFSFHVNQILIESTPCKVYEKNLPHVYVKNLNVIETRELH
ncbi:hypothetical protein E2R51_18785 [Jeotgalibacillus sp. S-D1]|uniref:PLAT/LH2 domain-containing protein n=1 Tax=Jeotgalibacillus sp. S-D1 TaxID=2552189 RepID=UPI001059E587|nr:PLAT/LH2 domain-containing protein [Jeotgalibacillus sp. S-D1]TDL30347.1 hypothetical protein E2R51_18785 [Jeotgalibacillus sp. S-D1]